MHDTAALTGQVFLQNYTTPSHRILDVGALDINGSLRGFAPVGACYVGLDRVAGPGVDITMEGYNIPFASESFDIVLSTSCLEHDPLFWVTFLEMCKVVKKGGFVYVSAPSNGPIHRHPVDCWRFYPDAADALAMWACRSGYDIRVVESFLVMPKLDVWTDFVAIFGRGEFVAPKIGVMMLVGGRKL